MRGAYTKAGYKLQCHRRLFVTTLPCTQRPVKPSAEWFQIIFQTLRTSLLQSRNLHTHSNTLRKTAKNNLLAYSHAPAGQIQSIFNPLLLRETSALVISMATHCSQCSWMLWFLCKSFNAYITPVESCHLKLGYSQSEWRSASWLAFCQSAISACRSQLTLTNTLPDWSRCPTAAAVRNNFDFSEAKYWLQSEPCRHAALCWIPFITPCQL